MHQQDDVVADTGRYFRVLTQQSAATLFTLRLPPHAKPLAAHVSTRSAVTGLLASYYDPEGHQWVVRHRPVRSTRATSADTVTLTVVVLMDEDDCYDVHIAMTTLLDAAHSESARHELQLRSDRYRAAGGGDEAAKPPRQSETVTLACSLPSDGGYALCGGGFVSDFPVYSARPAMPERDTHARLRRLLGNWTGRDGEDGDEEGKNGGDVVAACGAEGSLSPSTQLTELSAATDSAVVLARGEGAVEGECTAWAVTAAPNAGLACFAIGLRRRSPRERGGDTGDTTSNEPGADDWSKLRVSNHSKAPTTGCAPQTEDVASTAASLLARSLLLRQGVVVQHGGKGHFWSITLPAPHGSFTAPFTSRQLMTPTAVTVFYA